MEKKELVENLNCSWSRDSVRYIHMADPILKDAFLYVQEAGSFRTEKGYYTERANLPSFLIVYTLKGEGILHYQGKEYCCRRGQVFFINCMDHHLYENVDETWEFLWIHFYGAGAAEYYRYLYRDGENFRILMPESGEKTEAVMREVLELTRRNNLRSDILCSGILSELISLLILAGGIQSSPDKKIPELMRNVIRYLDSNYQMNVTLEKIGKQFGISKYYLCREFKKAAGETVGNYLINHRIAAAKELLRTTDLPVYMVAEQCGMGHVSHFIEMFQRREGFTPHEFRRMWSETEFAENKNT